MCHHYDQAYASSSYTWPYIRWNKAIPMVGLVRGMSLLASDRRMTVNKQITAFIYSVYPYVLYLASYLICICIRLCFIYTARCLFKPVMRPIGVVKREGLDVAVFWILYGRRLVLHRNNTLGTGILFSLKKREDFCDIHSSALCLNNACSTFLKHGLLTENWVHV